MIQASIDLGTNTCLLLIVDWDPQNQKIHEVFKDQSTVVRLGEGVDAHGYLTETATERVHACLKQYAELIERQGGRIEDTVCVATAQARDATNASSFFSKMEKELGFSFQILSAREEGRLTFLGALPPDQQHHPEKIAVMDIGGGSTELILQEEVKSLNIGSVRLTERFFDTDPVSDEAYWRCEEAIDEAVDSLKEAWREQLPAKEQLVGVAGTVTILAKWFLELKTFDPARIDQIKLGRGDVHRMVEGLKWRSVAERERDLNIDRKRADVILAGSMILWRMMEKLDFPDCQVSIRGLRYGALLHASPKA